MQYFSNSLVSSKTSTFLSILWFLMIEASSGGVAAVKLPPNVTVPAIIAFGDSFFDSGNNNFIKTLQKCNFPPYGKDFAGGIPTGRFSNGRVLSDLIAEELSIKRYVPPYLDPNLEPQDLLTGVNFASGGSGYDPLTCKTQNLISIPQQLEYFKEYIQQLKQLVGEERTQYIIANSVFIVSSGTNDIGNPCFDNPLRKRLTNDAFFTDRLVNIASSFLRELYKLGARRISVLSAPPVGCLPVARTLEGGTLRECAFDDNIAAQLFNSKLFTQIGFLASQLPASTINYIDYYTPFLSIIQNPDKYGFEQAVKGCCGTGLVEVSILCNEFVPVCPDDSKYLFWDSIHPTERGFQTLFSLIIDEFVNRLFGTHK